jgi:hypothetical protein
VVRHIDLSLINQLAIICYQLQIWRLADISLN